MPRTRSALSRRGFLGASFAAGVTWTVGDVLPACSTIVDDDSARELFRVRPGRDPQKTFPYSVAAGEPRSDGAVLWTRIDPGAAPMEGGETRVAYEIAHDADFAEPVVRGVAVTTAERDWTVKQRIEEPALKPHRVYHYRFITGGTASRTGRFTTLPAPGQDTSRLRFAYVSCQDYTNGYYSALAHLADEELDFAVYLGDFIYETTNDAAFQAAQTRPITLPGEGEAAETLEQYRFLYRTYLSDPDLQRLRERVPFVQIWDDHEFANDGYGAYDTDSASEEENHAPQRRLAATQAWWEYCPTDLPFDPDGDATDAIRTYRTLHCGDLIDLVVTDQRLYRDGPPCGLDTRDRYVTLGCDQREAGERSMLGAEQRDWFVDQVTSSEATWKIWANEVMCMQLTLEVPYAGELFPDLPPLRVFLNLDQWDGYPAERARILSALAEADVRNLVAITGDLHSFAAGYLKTDFDDEDSRAVGVELLGGSVSSSNFVEGVTLGLGGRFIPPETDLTWALKSSNPHLNYFNSAAHGYVVMEVTREAITATMKAVSTILARDARLLTLRQYRIPNGEPQLITTDRGTSELSNKDR